MNRQIAVRPIVIGLLVAAVALSGCSSKKENAGSSASLSPTPTSTGVVPSGLTSPPADSGSNSDSETASPAISGDPAAVKLYQQAMASLAKVDSVHLKGSGTDSGETIGVDLSFAKAKGVTGSITVKGGTMKIVSDGNDLYIQADAQSFAAFAGGAAPSSVMSALAGKWLKISKSESGVADAFGDFSSFTDLNSFAQAFTPSGAVSLAGTKTINGKQAVGILDSGNAADGSGILYVEDGGDHLPLAVAPGASSSGSSGEIDFLDYNKPVTITVPSDAIDINQLASMLMSPSTGS